MEGRVSKPAPWQVWYADLDPVEGREQGGPRPVVVVSSPFHLNLTGTALVTVLPLTTAEQPDWLHRVRIDVGKTTSYIITEQVRTISRARLTGTPVMRLDADEIAAVREILADMIDL